MKPLHLTLVAALAAFSLAVTACGGDTAVPTGAVAVVGDTEITREDLDAYLEQAKRQYEAQQQAFPSVGTPEYQNIERQYVAGLVQREQFAQKAEDLGIEVAEKDVDTEVRAFIKARFEGKQADFQKALKEQGFTLELLRDSLRNSLIGQKLFDEVTRDVIVAPSEVAEYYQQNQAQYSTPESRDVRHILIAEMGANQKVDFAASKAEADRIYTELQNGGDFAALVRQYSADTGSKASGGKLTISRGQTVPEFDKTAFEIEQGVVSKPVKTTYGYHVIEALSPVREATSTPLAKVRPSIRATLLQEKKSAFMREWAADLGDEYDGRTQYASGLEPPELPEEPTGTDTTAPSTE